MHQRIHLHPQVIILNLSVFHPSHSTTSVLLLSLTNDEYEYDDYTAVDPSQLCITINAITSATTTPEKQALGTFTRRKLNKLLNWRQWSEAEFRQLDRSSDLKM